MSVTLIRHDVTQGLPLANASVNCCVTSPPYWGLRNYGVDGQLGLEKTPEEYVQRLVGVMREVKRVLREDGTLWLNLGDSYSGGGKGGNPGNSPHIKQRTNSGSLSVRGVKRDGAKTKDLVGIPWMVAFALRADGWWLRSDIIWAKGYSFHPTTAGSCMPESVLDRPTRGHEYVFLLSKAESYYYDEEAVKEPSIYRDPRKPYAPGQVDERGDGHDRNGGKFRLPVVRGGFNGKTEAMPGRNAFRAIEAWRNLRSVWLINPKPFKEAHFATFPPKLVEPCMKAGCPVGGTVLDPFAGSGTVGVVAQALCRNAILLDLKDDYLRMAQDRLTLL